MADPLKNIPRGTKKGGAILELLKRLTAVEQSGGGGGTVSSGTTVTDLYENIVTSRQANDGTFTIATTGMIVKVVMIHLVSGEGITSNFGGLTVINGTNITVNNTGTGDFVEGDVLSIAAIGISTSTL